jgi:hypothetical protein
LLVFGCSREKGIRQAEIGKTGLREAKGSQGEIGKAEMKGSRPKGKPKDLKTINKAGSRMVKPLSQGLQAAKTKVSRADKKPSW